MKNPTPEELWLAFEALARKYPHDEGVRITADLARWLVEEHLRNQLPIPPVIQKVVRTVTEEVLSPIERPRSKKRV
jgi:hypothetical protein